ncbi:MAG: hypothetical protein H7274_15560 [Rhodoferax sp.]|nr:hypothetical protein [Rhodoferax sp.]
MKSITLPVFYQATLPPMESDFDEATEIRKRAGRITSASAAIEELMVAIIAATLFEEVVRRRELVVGSMLRSDWCSFAAKRKLLSIAIKEFKLISGPSKEELEKLLRGVSRYRNAFAHGRLVHNIDCHELHYFEGSPCVRRLDDTYFEELEHVFLSAWSELQSMQEALGAS